MSDSFFTQVGENVDCRKLFRVGPYNRMEEGTRVELPDARKFSLDDFVAEVVSAIGHSIYERLKYVVLVFSNYENSFPANELKVIKRLGIMDTNTLDEFDYYDDDDELFFFVRAYRITSVTVRNIIKLSLACHVGARPYLEPDCFFLTSDFSHAINVYDDRGMDIVNIKKQT